MPRSTNARTLGVLAALALVAGLAPPAPVAAQPPSPPVVEAAEDLLGDVTFSPPGRTFQDEVSVTLGTGIAGAEIRYTTDGELPTAGSPVYTGSPLSLTDTTELRAQPFIDGAPAGDVGTAIYLKESVTTAHDLPVLVFDSYGQGRPDREYMDVAAMLFEPGAGGTTSLTAAPTLATRAGFHLRGQSSSTFEKTPYRLEFWDNDDDDADYPVLGMPEQSDWVLRGPYSDKALIRDALVYDLGRDMGLYAPRFAFVEFYLNPDGGPLSDDDYMGVYMIVETIKNSKNRLDLKQLDEDDLTLPKIRGGYIWKFDWLAAEEPIVECPGAAATCWNFLEVADPDPLMPEQEQWLAGHLSEFNDVLHSPDFADPETGYRAYIEPRSFIDHIIINELSREMDSYVRSAYFYKDREGKITAGPLWDYDLTFGVGGFFQNDQIAGWQYEQVRQPIANNWIPRLLEDPAFVEELRARWRELRGGLLSDAQLSARVSALATPLAAGAERNFQRWPNLTTPMIGFFFTPTEPTWQGQVDYLLDWMLQRAAWLDSPDGWDINGPVNPPPSSPPPSSPPPSSPPPSSPAPPSPPPATGGCTATYTVVNQWPGGFQGEVRVTAGAAAINGWTVGWTFGDGQSITQSWGAVVTGGPAVTARNEAWNGTVAAGGSVTFGFLANWNGANNVPALTCTAT